MKKSLKLLSKIMIINFTLIVLVVYFGAQSKPAKKVKTILNTPSPALSITASLTPSPTLPSPLNDIKAQVSEHSTIDDCWMIISGKVYDLTSIFGSHPGGDAAISKYCGSDGTEAFATKEKNPPQNHTQADAAILEQYLIK